MLIQDFDVAQINGTVSMVSIVVNEDICDGCVSTKFADNLEYLSLNRMMHSQSQIASRTNDSFIPFFL